MKSQPRQHSGIKLTTIPHNTRVAVGRVPWAQTLISVGPRAGQWLVIGRHPLRPPLPRRPACPREIVDSLLRPSRASIRFHMLIHDDKLLTSICLLRGAGMLLGTQFIFLHTVRVDNWSVSRSGLSYLIFSEQEAGEILKLCIAESCCQAECASQ